MLLSAPKPLQAARAEQARAARVRADMSGPNTWRIIGRKAPGKKLGIAPEIVLAFSFLSFYVGYADLGEFRVDSAYTSASHLDYLLMCAPCFYGLRLARFIAIARNYRMPQYLEWLVFVVPLLVVIVCAVGSGDFVKAYALNHGYRFCGARPDHSGVLIFARPTDHCPLVPFGGPWRNH